MVISDVQRSLENLKLERDAILLYDALAALEKDEKRATAFRTIAGNERRHADIWANKLRDQGADVPPAAGPRARVRLIMVLARVLGTRAVSDLVQALEGDEEEAYSAQMSPDVASIAADEREHAEIWKRLASGDNGEGNVTGNGSGNGSRTVRATSSVDADARATVAAGRLAGRVPATIR